jgi:hypothetical protein
VIEAAAEVLGVKAIQSPYRNADQLERAIDDFAAEPNGGMVTVSPPPSGGNRELTRPVFLR